MRNLLVLSFFVITSAFAANIDELQRRMDLLAEEIQNLKANQLQVSDNKSVYGFGPSASKVYSLRKGVSIGGYGELVYLNQDDELENGSLNTNGTPESEFLRNVIYLGYKFNKDWVLNTEIEIEHVDQIYAEFAYLDYLASEKLNYRFGLILVPLGLVNEKHEPTLFNSVSRPEVEKNLIPSTWRENGIGVFGSLGNWDYRAYIVNGLNGDQFSKSGIRGGRKKGGASGETDSGNTSATAIAARFDYNLKSDSVVGGAIYHGDSSSSGTGGQIETSILQIHADYRYDAWEFKSLVVQTKLSGVVNNTTAFANNTAKEMQGYYFEFAYDFWAGKLNKSLKPFIRYEAYNTQKEIHTGQTEDKATDVTNITLGVAYKPLDRIILKADYLKKTNEADTGYDQISLAMGYNF